MNTQTLDTHSSSTAVFELVHYINGEAVAYVPYTTGCSSCCGAPAHAEPARSCCH